MKKFKIVTAVTFAIVVKDFSFLAFKNENVKTLSRVFKMAFDGCSHMFLFPCLIKPSANIIVAVSVFFKAF